MNRPSPDDMKAMWVMEYVEQLEKEIEDLKYSTKWSSLWILFVWILLIISDLLWL